MKKENKSFKIDLSISWRTAVQYIMLVIESHAKKSFTNGKARDEVQYQLLDMARVADEYVAKMKEGV